MVEEIKLQHLIDMLELVKAHSFRPNMKPFSQETIDMFDTTSKSIKLILNELINLRLQAKILAGRDNVSSECECGCYPIDETRAGWIIHVRCPSASEHIKNCNQL